MKLSTFYDMGLELNKEIILKWAYGDTIKKKFLGRESSRDKYDPWVLFVNDEQMRGIIEVLQIADKLPKSKNKILIPSE